MAMVAVTLKKLLISMGVAYLSVESNAFQINPIRDIGTMSSHGQRSTTAKSIINFRAAPTTDKTSSLVLRSSPQNDDLIDNAAEGDVIFDGQTTIALVGAQSLLVVGAVVAANVLNVPNNGLGEGFLIDTESIKSGVLTTLPLFTLAFVLDFVEKKVPALQDVTKATQRSVLALLGGSRKPITALGVSIALGAAAGLGEEMLFRGVLQSELGERFGDIAALTSSAVIFGALHAVTPLYALLAGLASLYFGELYLQYHNLAVPILCHGLYDVGALLAAHIQVTSMTDEQRIELENWIPPGSPESQI